MLGTIIVGIVVVAIVGGAVIIYKRKKDAENAKPPVAEQVVTAPTAPSKPIVVGDSGVDTGDSIDLMDAAIFADILSDAYQDSAIDYEEEIPTSEEVEEIAAADRSYREEEKEELDITKDVWTSSEDNDTKESIADKTWTHSESDDSSESVADKTWTSSGGSDSYSSSSGSSDYGSSDSFDSGSD